MAPKFSVVIPCYNRAELVLETLRSVKDQTFSDFECIIVDDGSSDHQNLKANIERLADERFHYTRQDNAGGGAARNRGIDLARGDYVAFLDSDDEFHPEKLAIAAEFIRKYPDAVIYTSAEVRRGSAKTWVRPNRGIGENESVAHYLFCANQFISTSTLVVPRALLQSTRFDPTLPKLQDPDLCVRLEKAGARFRMIDKPLTYWNDLAVAGRTSKKKMNALGDWLARNRSLLSTQEARGFRAVYLAAELGWRAPLRAISYLLVAVMSGAVSPKIFARQVLRSFLPRQVYRASVDWFVSAFGKA